MHRLALLNLSRSLKEQFLGNHKNLYKSFSIHEKGKMVQYIDSASASLTCNLVAKYFTWPKVVHKMAKVFQTVENCQNS